MAKGDPERGAAVDNALREMMHAASNLPVPDKLLAFIESLEESADPAADSEPDPDEPQ